MSLLLDKAPRFILYGLIFLLPVFFLPASGLSLDFNRQVFLAFALFGAAAILIINILRKGEMNFRWHIVFIPLLLFLLIDLISARGSGSFLHSFWGANAEADSLFNIILFALLGALAAFILRESAHIRNTVIFFIGGAVLGSVLFFVNYFSSFALSFVSPYAFAIYAGGAFVVVMWMLAGGVYVSHKTYLVVSAVVLFLTLLIVDIWVAWLGVAVGALLLIYYLSLGQKRVNASVIAPYLVVFAFATSFLFIDLSILDSGRLPGEVRLGREISMDIAQGSITSSAKNMLFGSGPATFSDQYRLQRDISINNTPLWNVSFDRGTGIFTSFFATAGVLGGGLLIIFWLMFLFFGAQNLFKNKFAKSAKVRGDSKKDDLDLGLSAIVFSGGLYFFIAWLFYETNFIILFAGFLFVAVWMGVRGEQRGINFTDSQQRTFFGMTGSVLLLVAIIFGFYSLYNAYSAEVSYDRAIAYVEKGNYPSALTELQKASVSNGLDKYWRKLSQAWFLRASQIFKDSSMSQETKDQLVQVGISAAESAAINAVSANPQNSINHEQLGDFYKNIIPVSTYAINLPFPNYDKAAELNPQSPFIPLKKARAHFEVSKRAKNQITDLTNQIAALDDAQNTEEGEDIKANLDKVQSLQKRLDDTRSIFLSSLESARYEAENALKLKSDFKDASDFLASLPK